jgi:Ankyrin repeats (3 copies)
MTIDNFSTPPNLLPVDSDEKKLAERVDNEDDHFNFDHLSDDDSSDDDDQDDSYDEEDDDDSIDNIFIEIEENRIAEKKSGLFLSLEMVAMLRASTSEGNLNTLIQDESIQRMIPRVNSTGNVNNAFKGSMVHSVQTKSPIDIRDTRSIADLTKPVDFLLSILESNGITTTDLTNNDELNSTYVKGCVTGYTLALTSAIRSCNVQALRALKENGKQTTFQCCNQFGESIVHAAARQGSLQVLQFLFQEAHVSCRVRCDTGRTPLHDACWTSGVPKFESIGFLLEQCPEFLLVRDKRLYTPLDYAPRDTYGVWKEFLDKKKDLIVAAFKKYESKQYR